MHLSRLRLAFFRNFEELDLNFSPNLNLIVGQNGQGKTNLIESIYLLAAGKSFRTTKIKDLLKIESNEAEISGEVQTELTKNILNIRLHRSGKKFLVNEKPTSSVVDYIGKLIAICFSPQDLNLVYGSPQIRRKFLDKLIVDLDKSKLAVLVDYNKALRSKNLLLKEEHVDRNSITSWNNILAKKAAEIVKNRLKVLENVKQAAEVIHSKFAEKDGEISLKLESQFYREEELSEEEIYALYDQSFEKEKILKKTILGPQHDDMQIFVGDKRAASFASQGQSRSLALALKLAAVDLVEDKINDSPVILLDDVDSELDQERLDLLHGFLLEKERQIFITGTELRSSLSEKSNKNQRIFTVQNGQINL